MMDGRINDDEHKDELEFQPVELPPKDFRPHPPPPRVRVSQEGSLTEEKQPPLDVNFGQELEGRDEEEEGEEPPDLVDRLDAPSAA
jgi:hypothetical protein